MNKIVVAIDLPEKDSLLLEQATRMAEKFGAELHLVHVIPPMGAFTAANMIDPLSGVDTHLLSTEVEWMDTQRELAENEARKLADSLPVKATVTKVLTGIVADTIAGYALEVNAGMIIVGAHRQNAISRWLNGDTSVKILRETNIPILIVPVAKVAQSL